MSKKKRAERLIGKMIETKHWGPATVLSVDVHETALCPTERLCLKLQRLPSRSWPDGLIFWEPVNARGRYEVIK